MAKKAKKENVKKASEGTAVLGLIVNLALPGLGTIIAGKYDIGTIQLVLSLVGCFFTMTFIGAIIGLPLYLAMWIWALITGIKILKESRKR
jgi:TM2 domain-containing membrane protein YozV